MSTRAKKILQLVVEQHSSTTDENIEPQELRNEILSDIVFPEVNTECAPSVENSDHELIHSDTESEIDPFANSSEDDPDYELSDVYSDTEIESVSQEEQQGSESDGPVDGDDAGMYNNCSILSDCLIYFIYL